MRSSVPGAAEVEVKSPPGAPRMAIRLRPVEPRRLACGRSMRSSDPNRV